MVIYLFPMLDWSGSIMRMAEATGALAGEETQTRMGRQEWVSLRACRR